MNNSSDDKIIKGVNYCANVDRLGKCEDCPIKAECDRDDVLIKTVADLVNRLKAKAEQLQALVNEMSDYFPTCIDCEGKTEFGERTDECVYLMNTTNYCAKRGVMNISSIRSENRKLKAEIESVTRQAAMWHREAELNAAELIKSQAEIERLREESKSFADIGKMYSEIKAEAIKEFAERLKSKKKQQQ